jgi:hypothetical protein
MKHLWLIGMLLLTGTAVVHRMSAQAQGSGGAFVVATCGTLPLAYAVGATRSLTVNTNGQVCQ